jgi:tetratricopeptide (TPR) repeat protein
MEADVRLRTWFEDLNGRINEDQRKLLRALSLYEDLFNRGVVQLTCKFLNIAQPNESFDELRRRYLIQQHTPYRWKVHHLIGFYASLEVPKDESSQLLVMFANYCLRGSFSGSGFLSDDEARLVIRAVHFLQRAGMHSRSQRLLMKLSATVKARGLYGLFIGPAETELKESPVRDTWIDYDLAHCHFILGSLKRAFEILEPVLFMVPESERNKRVAAVRLYAELLAAVERYDVALQKLREVLAAVDVRMLNSTVRAHAQSIEVMLLTYLGRYQEGRFLAEAMLADAAVRNDRRSVAIARTRLGVVESRCGNTAQAKDYLGQAVDDFVECQDVRGHAWALLELGNVLLDLQEKQQAAVMFQRALEIYSATGECSKEYRDLLTTIFAKGSTDTWSSRILDELDRVRSSGDLFRRGELYSSTGQGR